MNGTVVVNGDHAENGEIGGSDLLTFKQPALLRNSLDEQIELLLLTWILLLYRGSGSNEDGHVFWSYQLCGKPHSSLPPQASGLITDVVVRGQESILDALERIRRIRRIDEPVENKGRARDGIYIALSNSSELENGSQVAPFCIEARTTKDQLCVTVTDSPKIFSPSMTNTFVQAYAEILDSILIDLNCTIAQIACVTTSELNTIWNWNETVPPLIDSCIHDIIIQNASEHPDKPAVVSWDGELSYGQIDSLSSRVAIGLLERNIEVGQPVLLCFEKSIWTIVAVLAAMKAGGALVLTDPSQPEARLQTIAGEVGARLVLTSVRQAELGHKIAPNAAVLVVGPALLEGSADLPSQSIAFPNVPGSSTLYIIFTSGSTGKPKGVVISHANYTSGAIPRAQAVGYKAHSRVLDFPSYAFDVSVDCMLCTLANGGCICVPSEDQRVNDLPGAIRSMSVNMAHMTPSVARVLDPDILESLEVLGLGGEAVSARDATTFGQKTKVIIAYGPSECTVGCTINNDVGMNRTYTTIGKGVGCATWIVDPTDHDRLTPVGAVGELLVEGPIVGTGYLNNPTNTSGVFIENPPWLLTGCGKASGRQGRLYKTGDLVRYDPGGSGSIFFVGRADQQVKLRGQRVELGEIEYHLQSKLPPGTMSAVEVITPGNNKENATLVAFIAEQKIAEQKNKDVEAVNETFSQELRGVLLNIEQELSVVLPRYMVPAAFIPLTEIPLLVSCKTDRKKLRALGAAMSRKDLAKLKLQKAEKHKPGTEVERRLQLLWSRLLGDGIDIGIEDNFFDVGGDSLKAMRLVAAARAEGLGITVADIFQHPKLVDMALTMREINPDTQIDIPAFSLIPGAWTETNARTETGILCDIEPSIIEDIYPCTPLQEGLMALSAKVSEAYVAQRVVELPDFDTATKLRTAFDTAFVDCPILRTRIVQVPRRGLMQVVTNERILWHSSNSLDEYLRQDRKNPMGLGAALSRFALIRDQGTGKTHIVLTIHHALYDGWSMPLVVERVNRAYHGFKTERPAPFKSFIKYLCDIDRTASEDYWRKKLQGATGLQFPVLPEPGYQPQAESLLEHYIPLTKRSTSNTSIATAIRGAWALVAAEYTATNDVIFGETLTGRNASIEGIDQIEGPMITTVPIRIHIDRDKLVREYLKEIHDEGVSRIQHEHLGLQHIRRLTLDAREACELRTGLVIHPAMEPDAGDQNKDNPANGFVPAGDVEAASEALKFNSYSLMLVCSFDQQGFLVMASFDSKTVDVPQMSKVLELFGHVVQFFCESPNKKIGDSMRSFEENATELMRLSRSGIAHLNAKKGTAVGQDFSNAVGTWIVEPLNPDHLLPIGAVGELLIESKAESSLPSIADPQWFSAMGAGVCDKNSGSLHKTGRLAKYRSDGAIAFVTGGNYQNNFKETYTRSRQTPSVRQEETSLTAKEHKLKGFWSRVLDINEAEIGVDDSFFDLGGDSIGAMKLVSEARMEGFRLTVAQIFKHKTLKKMADVLQRSLPLKTIPNTSNAPFSTLDVQDMETFLSKKIQPALRDPAWKIKDVLPARPLQAIAIKGTVQLPRFSARYELFYFDTHVDEHRLFESCQELVARNEILRTVFCEIDGRYYGVILQKILAPLETYDIERDLEAFSHKLCNLDVETRMPFGSSFVKFLFVRCTGGRSCLILRISHAQYDEICLPILLRQLSALYEGKIVPRALPFSSYVKHVVKENIPQSIQYWKDLLEGSSMTVLRPETPLNSRVPAAVMRTFDISNRPKDITVATIPTAAWALCLAQRLGLRDVTFGEVVSGRNIDYPDSDIVMGPCWQYIPVRVRFEAGWTALDLLESVQRQHITSTRFEGIGLSELIENCTDWPRTVDWFDSVVHQDVAHVESLEFLSATSQMETVYPHAEPLREWKIQAFLKGNELSIEVVTFESWLECASSLLDGIEGAMMQLLKKPQSPLFGEQV